METTQTYQSQNVFIKFFFFKKYQKSKTVTEIELQQANEIQAWWSHGQHLLW